MERTARIALAALAVVFLFSTTTFAQIEFKLHWMPDSLAWGVFARPELGLNPSKYTIIGSGQVTLVAPNGSEFRELKSFSGVWAQNAFVAAPIENPSKDYISFGMSSNDPAIVLEEGMETLLLTFQPRDGACPETLYLIANDDPFNVLPNSKHSNPGNDLSVMDPVKGIFYVFTKNYDLDAWDCSPGKEKPVGDFIQAFGRRRKLVQRP